MALPAAGRSALAAVLACLLAGCSSSGRVAEHRALVAAGEAVRARETGHTHEEVLRDFELFVRRDVDLTREKALEEKRHVAAKYRWVYLGGAALGVAGALLATSDDDPFVNTSVSVAASVAGFAIGIAGGVAALTEGRKLDRCREELAAGEESLRGWVVATFRPTAEPVSEDLWRAYVRRTHELKGLESCIAVP